MRHMREPTDNEIAEEMSTLREKERAAKKTLKRHREGDDSDDWVPERLDWLETVQELHSTKLSRLEEMIGDLHKAKFG